MPRELRPRESPLRYAVSADYSIEDHANAGGPSVVHLVDEEESGSEFEPDKGPTGSRKVPSGGEDEDVDMNDVQDPESEVEKTPKRSRKTTPPSSRNPRAPASSTTNPGNPPMFASSKTRRTIT